MSKIKIKKRQKQENKKIASKHIIELFNIAEKHRGENIEQNAINLAINYSIKYKVKIPEHLKKNFCKKCHKLYSDSTKIRIKSGKKPYIIKTCTCGDIRRIPFDKVKGKSESLNKSI